LFDFFARRFLFLFFFGVVVIVVAAAVGFAFAIEPEVRLLRDLQIIKLNAVEAAYCNHG
jgi:hypothetical protein